MGRLPALCLLAAGFLLGPSGDAHAQRRGADTTHTPSGTPGKTASQLPTPVPRRDSVQAPSGAPRGDTTRRPEGSAGRGPETDSVRVHAAGADTSRRFTPGKSPGLAMLLSAVLPGAGQFYNQSYWKVPIVTGLGVFFASRWLQYNRNVIENRDAYQASLATVPGGNNRFLVARDFYKDQRDSYTWYFLLLYLINIADAYVDASLFDFNVSGDLSGRGVPQAVPAAALTLRIRF